jgi:hypothetical protein
MSLFSNIPKTVSNWIGVPGLIIAFTIALAIWLYFDFVVEMTLNGTMTLGVSICSLLIVSFFKIVSGLFRTSCTAKDDAHDKK